MAFISFQWLTLVGIIWLQAISGTNSNFPAYSTQLKQILSFSQMQINMFAFASDAGKLVGFLSGIASVLLRLPLWVVLIFGSILGLIGYGVEYLLTNRISSMPHWLVFLLNFWAGNSICWINNVCYIIAISNFNPSDLQVVVGLSTSYQGLSPKLYVAIADVLPSHNKASVFLILNSILPLIVSLIAVPVTREIEVSRSRIRGVELVLMFVLTILTCIYAVLTSLQLVSHKLPPWINLISILLFLLFPLVVPKLVRRTESELEEGPEVSVREESGVSSMLIRLDFWLYIFVYFFGATLGLVFMNNLGQIAESRGSSNTSLVSLSSSFLFFGRLMPPLLDYVCRGRFRITRTASMIAFMGSMAGAFLLLLHESEAALYASTAIIGACTGAITSISVSLTAELFGRKNFPVNHNVVVGNIPIGSLLFGFLAAHLYHKEADGDEKCTGMRCYRSTFIIWCSLCAFGTLLACMLYRRTRSFYSQRQ